MPVQSDSMMRQIAEAARRRRPLFRVTVSPRVARFLVAAGAQPAAQPEVVASGPAEPLPAALEAAVGGVAVVPVIRKVPVAVSRRRGPFAKMAVYLGLVDKGEDWGAFEGELEEPEGMAGLARVLTVHPRSYNDARTVGEIFRDGNPVIMNLTEMPDSDAKRIIDFAAGLIFAARGSIERVTNKVFLLTPPPAGEADLPAEEAATAHGAPERGVQA
jgi:hypothetical protein